VFQKKMRKLLFIAALLVASLACAATQGAGGASAQKQTSARATPSNSSAGASAPSPKVTEIKEAELKSLLGAGDARQRPLLVNFWATWCEPCRAEFPDLVRVRGQYTADQLDFVVVSLDDPPDISKAVPQFLAEVHATALPAYLLHADDEDAAIKMVDPAWDGELPATFLYDRAGRVVFKHTGAVKPDELRAAIDQTLNAKPGDAATTSAINSAATGTTGAASSAPVAGPPVHEIKAADFRQLLQSSAAAGRPLLVNFWATWCHGCRQEMPDLVKIDGQNESRGLDFITVSLDKLSEIDKGVPEFLGQVGGSRVRAYLLDESETDAAMQIADPAWKGEMPATFLYDRQGRLAYTHKGVITPAEVQAAIEKILSAKPQGAGAQQP
jgi:thiol-disulfide isomerase/thioredoxin